MRKTKIICTIGPASESEDRLRELMLAGMNVARFNFSHGTHEEHKMKFARVIKVSGELGLPVATLLDTKGPEIRLRDFKDGKAELKEGQKFVLTTEEILGDSQIASITYKNLKNDIKLQKNKEMMLNHLFILSLFLIKPSILSEYLHTTQKAATTKAPIISHIIIPHQVVSGIKPTE